MGPAYGLAPFGMYRPKGGIMKYVVKHPGQPAETIESETIGLKTLQHHVGGLITGAYVPELAEKGIDVFANDEGLLMGLQPNIGWMIESHPMILVGGLVFTSSDEEGETIGLTEEQIKAVEEFTERTSRSLGSVLFRIALGQ
jgi:hypothetical protein